VTARKTPLRKPNHGEGIVSIEPRPKRAYDCVGLLHFSLFNCMMFVLSPALHDIHHTSMARYSLRLARKTPLRKPNRGKGIVSIEPRPKRAYDCVGLLHFSLFNCMIRLYCPWPYMM